MRIIIYFIVIAVLSLGLIFTGLGQVSLQRRMLSTFKSAPAKVIHSETKAVLPGGYQVEMTYEYVRGNNRYKASRVTPMTVLASQQWADDVVKRHGAESPITVYVDPHDPGVSFVLPIASFLPYGLILLGTALAVLAVLPLRVGGVFQSPPRPLHDGRSNWYQLTPSGSPEGQALFLLSLAGLWLLVGAGACVHYFTHGPVNTLTIVMIVFYGLIGMVLLIKGLRRLKPTGRIRTLHVWTTLKELPVCAPLVVKTEMVLARSTPIASARIALVCNRHSGFGRQQLFNVSHAITGKTEVAKGQAFQADHTFEIPTNKQRASTSPYAQLRFPRIDWLIEIEITFEKGPTCCYQFPVELIPDRRKTAR